MPRIAPWPSDGLRLISQGAVGCGCWLRQDASETSRQYSFRAGIDTQKRCASRRVATGAAKMDLWARITTERIDFIRAASLLPSMRQQTILGRIATKKDQDYDERDCAAIHRA